METKQIKVREGFFAAVVDKKDGIYVSFHRTVKAATRAAKARGNSVSAVWNVHPGDEVTVLA